MRRWLNHVRAAYESCTDVDLITATRNGDLHAFGELWVRYEQIAAAVARQLSPQSADDLVAEAFTAILRCLQTGKGPSDSFRAYLVATVRSKHVDHWRRERRCTSVAEIEVIDDLAVARRERFEPEELDEAELEKALDAWGCLDQRQQWLIRATAIEGRSTSEVAAELGARPGTVAVWVHRARERLRAAYLTHAVPAAEDPECEPFRNRFPRYLRAGLTARQQAEMDLHLESCATCGRALAAATEVNRRMRVAVGPLLPGLALGLAPASGSGSLLGWIRSGGHTLGTKAAVAAAGLAAAVAVPIVIGGHDQPTAPDRTPTVATQDLAVPAPTLAARRLPVEKVPTPARVVADSAVATAPPRPTSTSRSAPASSPPEPVVLTTAGPAVAPPTPATLTIGSGTASFTITTPDPADTSGTVVVELPDGWSFTAIKLTGMTGGSLSTSYSGSNTATLTLSHVSTDPSTGALHLTVSGSGPPMPDPQARVTTTLNGNPPSSSTQPLA